MNSEKKRSKTFLFQIAVFYGWILITIATLAMYFMLNKTGDVSFTAGKDSFIKIMSLLTPQLTLMCVFFFSHKEKEITKNKNLGICLSLTFIYLLFFFFCLYWGVYHKNFGPDQDIDYNVDAFVTYIGFLSILGVAPIGYLFSTSKVDKTTNEGVE